MKPKKSNSGIIKSFTIKRLYGLKNITIPFSSPYKILVAENGAGKTTVLNIFYSMLSCKFHKLRSYDFESISIKFSSGEVATINKEQMDSQEAEAEPRHMIEHLLRTFPEHVIDEFMHDMRRKPASLITRNPIFRRVQEMTQLPSRAIINELRHRQRLGRHSQLELGDLEDTHLFEARKIIQKYFKQEILYFPTYRRIEEDLQNLGLDEDDISISEDNQLIQFGMNDVKKRVDQITSDIKNSSIEWFSKINGQMLSQLIDGIKISQEMKDSIKKPEAIGIVLDRIGENISEPGKKHILELIRSKKELGATHDPLVYFLSNLIKVYDQQRDKDNAIKEFAKVSNNYLVGKEVVYNESKVSIDIIQIRTGKRVSIEKLSSGEKQIISLFSRLYLNSSQDFALFIDEPELSLSIEWQRQFLPDIVGSGRCSFLLATTHSPFIFENSLDTYTHELTLYIKEDQRRKTR